MFLKNSTCEIPRSHTKWEDLILHYVCVLVALFWLLSIPHLLQLGTTREKSHMTVCVIALIPILGFRRVITQPNSCTDQCKNNCILRKPMPRAQRSLRLRSDPKSGFKSSSRRWPLVSSSSSSSSRSDPETVRSVCLNCLLGCARSSWRRAGSDTEKRTTSYFLCFSHNNQYQYQYACTCCMFPCVCVCTIVKLAELYWAKSLWETVSADCNLFREYRTFVTVNLRGEQHMWSHKNTVWQVSQEITCIAETIGEEMAA